jgi:hypothetical protein
LLKQVKHWSGRVARILIDECLDWPLAAFLSGHQVETVHSLRWSGISGSALLARMEGRFDVLVTADQSLPGQQNLHRRPLPQSCLARAAIAFRRSWNSCRSYGSRSKGSGPARWLRFPRRRLASTARDSCECAGRAAEAAQVFSFAPNLPLR